MGVATLRFAGFAVVDSTALELGRALRLQGYEEFALSARSMDVGKTYIP